MQGGVRGAAGGGAGQPRPGPAQAGGGGQPPTRDAASLRAKQLPMQQADLPPQP